MVCQIKIKLNCLKSTFPVVRGLRTLLIFFELINNEQKSFTTPGKRLRRSTRIGQKYLNEDT